jgi:hypothetical protein
MTRYAYYIYYLSLHLLHLCSRREKRPGKGDAVTRGRKMMDICVSPPEGLYYPRSELEVLELNPVLYHVPVSLDEGWFAARWPGSRNKRMSAQNYCRSHRTIQGRKYEDTWNKILKGGQFHRIIKHRCEELRIIQKFLSEPRRPPAE